MEGIASVKTIAYAATIGGDLATLLRRFERSFPAKRKQERDESFRRGGGEGGIDESRMDPMVDLNRLFFFFFFTDAQLTVGKFG